MWSFSEYTIDQMNKTSKDLPYVLFKNECNTNGDNDGASAGAEHTPCAAKVHHYDISSEQFKWSMGGCGSNESITMYQVYSI